MNTNTAAKAIEAFAQFIIADRKIENPTIEQCNEIAAHAIRNLAQIVEAYEKGLVA